MSDQVTEPVVHVLIVEDDPAYNRALTISFERSGATVVSTDTVAGGLAASRAQQFDVAIVDISLPDDTGDVVLQELARVNTAGLRIAISGYRSSLDSLRTSAAHAFFLKPLDAAGLANSLVETLRKVAVRP